MPVAKDNPILKSTAEQRIAPNRVRGPQWRMGLLKTILHLERPITASQLGLVSISGQQFRPEWDKECYYYSMALSGLS